MYSQQIMYKLEAYSTAVTFFWLFESNQILLDRKDDINKFIAIVFALSEV